MILDAIRELKCRSLNGYVPEDDQARAVEISDPLGCRCSNQINSDSNYSCLDGFL